MKIAIFGSGGVGGYFGGRLAQSGQDVTFIARGGHLAAIRESGLRVDSAEGNFTVLPAQATDSPQSIGEVDLVLLCLKGWHLDDALPQMKPLIGVETTLLPLMNGMEHMDKLFAAFGTEHVLGGLSRISSFIEGPGHIRHVGVQPYIAFGEWDNSKSERIQKLEGLFKSVNGITAENPPDIRVAMWEKFIFICATSAVGAYARQPAGGYRSDPDMRVMLIRALDEAAAIARARGVPVAENIVDAVMKRIDNLPAHTVASMHKDIVEGKPSELNEQTGAVIRMGKALGVPTPTHEKLFAALSPLEQKARSR